jgi:hypothetical protein
MLTYCAAGTPLKRKPEPNSEGRICEGRMKVEIQRPKNRPRASIRISIFGLLSDFGSSDFGLRGDVCNRL